MQTVCSRCQARGGPPAYVVAAPPTQRSILTFCLTTSRARIQVSHPRIRRHCSTFPWSLTLLYSTWGGSRFHREISGLIGDIYQKSSIVNPRVGRFIFTLIVPRVVAAIKRSQLHHLVKVYSGAVEESTRPSSYRRQTTILVAATRGSQNGRNDMLRDKRGPSISWRCRALG